MNKMFMGCLAFAALALMVGQAVAGANNAGNNAANNAFNNAVNQAQNNGVAVMETYTSTSTVTVPGNTNTDYQPLPGDPGVEVAPVNSSVTEPVIVQEDMLIEETEDGE